MTMPDVGGIVDQSVLNRARAGVAAKKHGVPETLLIGILSHESGGTFKTDPGGNGGGIGQFTTDTAKAYGVTQEQLRRDPDLAVDLAAKLLKDNMTALGGDANKAAAAYYVGSGTIAQAVKEGGADGWLAAADRIAKEKGYTDLNGGVSPSQYLTKVGGQGSQRPSQVGGTSTPSSTPGTYTRPTPDQFKNPDTGQIDVQAYNRALMEYEKFTKPEKDEKDSRVQDFASYLDAAMNQIGNEIESGNLDVAKASGEFKRRMDAYDSASKNYTSMLGYGVPLGAKTIPGTNIDISGPGQVVEWNPFQEAANIVNGTPDLTSFKTPDASMDRALKLAQKLYGASGVSPAAVNTAQQFTGPGNGFVDYSKVPVPAPDPDAGADTGGYGGVYGR